MIIFHFKYISQRTRGIIPTAAAVLQIYMQLSPCRRAGMGFLIIFEGGRRDGGYDYFVGDGGWGVSVIEDCNTGLAADFLINYHKVYNAV